MKFVDEVLRWSCAWNKVALPELQCKTQYLFSPIRLCLKGFLLLLWKGTAGPGRSDSRARFLGDASPPLMLLVFFWFQTEASQPRFLTPRHHQSSALLCVAFLCLALHRLAVPCLASPCFALPCIALHCVTLLCIALPFALPCFALFCFALICI
jgi:hypothetical protein